MNTQAVDLQFSILGASLPIDHAYSLYSAISRLLGPALHDANGLGIRPINGLRSAPGEIQLTATSRLRIRTSTDYIPLLLKLSGKQLDLDGHCVRVGVPQVVGLKLAPTLTARTVTIKGFTAPEPFLAAARRRLTNPPHDDPLSSGLGLSPRVTLGIPVHRIGPRTGQPIRRVLQIKGRRIVGFPLIVSDLTAEESLLLQEKGLGGRRHMGCGIFVPALECTLES